MKQLLFSFIMAATAVFSASADIVIDKPVSKDCPTSFVIIADSATCAATRPAMLRYKNALEAGRSRYLYRKR